MTSKRVGCATDDELSIFCCGCNAQVDARLTNGAEVYPHRSDLHHLPFWKCDHCGNYVGCHHKTKDKTRPLGNIPTPELRNARRHIHTILDPIWRGGTMDRAELYLKLSELLGYEYHTAQIASIEEARAVYRAVLKIASSTTDETNMLPND